MDRARLGTGGLATVGLLWAGSNWFAARPFFSSMNLQAFRRWRCSPARRRGNGTDLSVILVSPGASATTSMGVALEALGLGPAWHPGEFQVYFPEALEPEILPDDLVGPLQRCDVRAVSPDLHFDLCAKLLSVSPHARVLRMVKPWHDWKRSVDRMPRDARCNAREALAWSLLCHWVPYGWLLRGRPAAAGGGGGGSFTSGTPMSMLLHHCDAYVRVRREPDTFARQHPAGSHLDAAFGLAALYTNETLYGALQERIRALAPRERLVEFDLQRHGWTELASALGLALPRAEKEFPRARAHGTSTFGGCNVFIKLQLFPARLLAFYLAMTVSIFLNFQAFWLCAHCLARWWVSETSAGLQG